MQISVIVPAIDEADRLHGLLEYVLSYGGECLKEVVVADGGSSDDTVRLAENAGAVVVHSRQGRAVQMNAGAAVAAGDILFFMHADVVPPPSFTRDILQTVSEGAVSGTYRSRYANGPWLMRLNAWLTRFRRLSFRGGDQGLFIAKKQFEALGGFNSAMQIMEDYDLLKKIMKRHKDAFVILPDEMLISTRKYNGKSYFRVMMANLLVFTLYRLGVSDRFLAKCYQKLLG